MLRVFAVDPLAESFRRGMTSVTGTVVIRLAVCVLLATLCCDTTAAETSDGSSAIRLNTVGFLPHSPKSASIVAPCKEFSLRDAGTGEEVYRGEVGQGRINADTGQRVRVADFSPFQEEGEYVLVVPGVGRSDRFAVSSHVYNGPFFVVTRGMYLWRCGTAVSGKHNGEHFQHEACHLGDGSLDHVPHGTDEKTRDGVGGWHDAGDYNKYTVNGAFTAGMLLHAWQLHERSAEPSSI